jgi:hypothetical protein
LVHAINEPFDTLMDRSNTERHANAERAARAAVGPRMLRHALSYGGCDTQLQSKVRVAVILIIFLIIFWDTTIHKKILSDNGNK